VLEGLEDRLTPTISLSSSGLVPTFGTKGTAYTQFFERADSVANGAVIQADGKVVAVGDVAGGSDFIVTRYNADGSPDTSFGPNHNGEVLTAFAKPAVATAVAMESDGKILVAGYTLAYASVTGDFALARYNADGSLDTSFGTGGLVTTGFAIFGTDAGNMANCIVIDSAGRIVLGGYTTDPISTNSLFALARYTVNGILDRTFGTGGEVVTQLSGSDYSGIDAAALDARGRIVVAGYYATGTDNTGNPATRFALARYNTNGSLDRTFGSGGEVITNIRTGNDDSANGLTIQPDGKIVAAGSTYDPNKSLRDFALARYTTGGNLDKTFGIGGTVVTDFGNTGFSDINAVTLDAQGRIAVAGYTSPGYNHNPVAYDSLPAFALARYTSSGSLDKSFGTGGEVVGTGLPGGLEAAKGIARGPNGQLLVVGVRLSLLVGTYGDFALARYNVNGSLDQSFGTLGQVSTPLTAPVNSNLDVVAAQPDGKLIVAASLLGPNGDVGILRLNKDGSLDTTFGNGGEVFAPLQHSYSTEQIASVFVQPDGKIVVVVYYDQSGNPGQGYVSLLRFDADGSVDSSFGTGGRTLLIELPRQQTYSGLAYVFAGAIVQPDGKIVFAAGNGNLDLFRLNKNGSLDTSFGSNHNGSVVTALSSPGTNAIVLQPDGKIVLTGNVNFDLALARYNADGSPDRTFGTGGVVHTSLTAGGIAGTVLQSGGKIVVGGNGGTKGGFFLVRFNANGSLDKTFGTAGQVLTDFGANGTARSIVIDSAGRIALAGVNDYTEFNTTIYLARFNSNGQPDTHFAARGRLMTYFPHPNPPFPNYPRVALTFEPQGPLVVAGNSPPTGAIDVTEYIA
jgi:uncharacterized delta-60 repeat protein